MYDDINTTIFSVDSPLYFIDHVLPTAICAIFQIAREQISLLHLPRRCMFDHHTIPTNEQVYWEYSSLGERVKD